MDREGRAGEQARSARHEVRRHVATSGENRRRPDWTYYKRPLLEDLLALKQILVRKYQRRRASSEDVASVENLIADQTEAES